MAIVDESSERRRGCCIGSSPAAGDVGFAYLDRARADAFLAGLKARTIEALAIGVGDSVADVGCGTGEDVVAMSAPATGVFAVGLDLSSRNVIEAQRRHRHAGVAFVIADAHSLPIFDRSLDSCRVERTLQHVADPAVVVSEIARTLRPGGRVALCEPDWASCALAGATEHVSALVLAHWIDGRSSNPSVGRNLAGLLVDAGFENASLKCEAIIYRSLDEAASAFPLHRAATQAAESGVVGEQEAVAWIDDLRTASEFGRFAFAIPLFTAVGIKPS